MKQKKYNPALRFVKEAYETKDLEAVYEKMTQGDWIVIGMSKGSDGTYLFALGRVC